MTVDDKITVDATASQDAGPQSPASQDKAQFLATFTEDEDKSIMKKFDRRFLLLIGILYMTKNLDYQNAAIVKVLQVGEPRNILTELNMTPNEYNRVQSIYFISYIVFEVPSNLLLKKMTPRLWQSRICLSWGIVLACHAAIQKKRLVLRSPLFARHDGSRVYLLEGIWTILLAVVIYFVLPDYPKSPRSNKWLTQREPKYLETRLSENAPLTHESAFSSKEIKASLSDPRTYSFMINQILVNLAGYGLQWYLPTITTSLGFAGLPRNQLLNIPPTAAAVISIIIAGQLLKRAWVTRPAFTQPINALMAVGFIMFFTVTSKGAIYAACVIGTMAYSVYFIPFWAWRSSTLKGATGTAFTLAFQSSIGQIGGVVGPQLFLEKYAHNGYKVPFAVCAAAVIIAWAANLWTWWLTRNVEWDVRRIRRLRIQAEKKGRVYGEDDVAVCEERGFYRGLHKAEGEQKV